MKREESYRHCGIFFKARDPAALIAWYKKHLGIDVQEWGGAAFTWTDDAGNPTKGTTIWSVSGTGGRLLRAEHSSLHDQLPRGGRRRAAQGPARRGLQCSRKTDDSEYGEFGWVMDPEGNKVELWQPPAGQ